MLNSEGCARSEIRNTKVAEPNSILQALGLKRKCQESQKVSQPHEKGGKKTSETHPTVENLSSAFHFESGKFLSF